MRIILISFLVHIITAIHADQYSIFEKDGRYGLKKGSEIIVPAVYEQLGWSSGNKEVFEGVIGFKRKNLWGLLSTKNKILSENKFYTLEPFSEGFLKASIKGRFSNLLFHGLLDTSGEVKVSFNYFHLEPLNPYLKVTEFDPYQSKVGVLSFENKIIIPLKYKQIRQEGRWLVADRYDYRKDIFLENTLVIQNLDSVRIKAGVTCFQNGKSGYLDSNGALIHDLEFKNILIEGSQIKPIEFPTWEVFDQDRKLMQHRCDSIIRMDSTWVMYLNGAKHLIYSHDKLNISNDYILEAISNSKLIVRHSRTNLSEVWNPDGKPIIQEQDFITPMGNHFAARKKEEWHLYNSFGTKLTRYQLQSLQKGIDNHFIAKKNDYWGILDFNGNTYVSFKFDSLVTGGSNRYLANFIGRWGILDKHGNWAVPPRFEMISTHGKLHVGRRGLGYTYFLEDKYLYKRTYNISRSLGEHHVIEGEDGYYGLLDPKGNVIAQPEYESIEKIESYFKLRSGDNVMLLDRDGRIIVSLDQEFEDCEAIREGYIPAKKNGKWGFLDDQGRLRIANRYEQVKPFKEGLAGFQLRGKWGFLDKDEKLTIQPHYQLVSSFNHGMAIVQEDNKYGLIDSTGKFVVTAEWKYIKQTPNGNYLVENDHGLWGLADSKGSFVLRPDFNSLEDHGQEIIVEKNQRKGILDYGGAQKFKIIYSEIRIENEFILLKR